MNVKQHVHLGPLLVVLVPRNPSSGHVTSDPLVSVSSGVPAPPKSKMSATGGRPPAKGKLLVPDAAQREAGPHGIQAGPHGAQADPAAPGPQEDLQLVQQQQRGQTPGDQQPRPSVERLEVTSFILKSTGTNSTSLHMNAA